MLAVIAVCAVACVFLNAVTLTIPCDHGKGDIIGGYLPSGIVVDVRALQSNGEYEIVAKNVLVANEARWEWENNRNKCYIDL